MFICLVVVGMYGSNVGVRLRGWSVRGLGVRKCVVGR